MVITSGAIIGYVQRIGRSDNFAAYSWYADEPDTVRVLANPELQDLAVVRGRDNLFHAIKRTLTRDEVLRVHCGTLVPAIPVDVTPYNSICRAATLEILMDMLAKTI